MRAEVHERGHKVRDHTHTVHSSIRWPERGVCDTSAAHTLAARCMLGAALFHRRIVRVFSSLCTSRPPRARLLLTHSLSLTRCQKHGAFPSRAKALHDEDLVVCTEHVLSLFFAPSHPIPASNRRLNNAMFCYVPMVVAYSPTDMWPPIWLTVAYTLSCAPTPPHCTPPTAVNSPLR